MNFLRKWRLLRRGDDGSTTYKSYSDDGSYTMTIYADGSKFVHGIVGVNLEKAMAAGPSTSNASLPVAPVEPSLEALPEPVRVRTPMLEPEPTAPNSAVETQLHRDAKMMAKSVYAFGRQHRNQLLQGIPTAVQTERINYACKQGWITVSDDGIVKPGPHRPVDLMPAIEPHLSARERELRWGPDEPIVVMRNPY
jgi:hypothetical protein